MIKLTFDNVVKCQGQKSTELLVFVYVLMKILMLVSIIK